MTDKPRAQLAEVKLKGVILFPEHLTIEEAQGFPALLYTWAGTHGQKELLAQLDLVMGTNGIEITAPYGDGSLYRYFRMVQACYQACIEARRLYNIVELPDQAPMPPRNRSIH